MKKKTLILLTALVVLCLLMAGTLAYFTQEEIAHNVITSGAIDIELIEKAIKDGKEVDFEDVEGIMPGMDISKIVKIENTGDSDAFVRIKLGYKVVLADGTEVEPDESLVKIDFDDANWTWTDGNIWYYNKPLKSGETTPPLFTTVAFSTAIGNDYQGAKFTIDVSAQAVQAANNGTDPAAAAGWPA